MNLHRNCMICTFSEFDCIYLFMKSVLKFKMPKQNNFISFDGGFIQDK